MPGRTVQLLASSRLEEGGSGIDRAGPTAAMRSSSISTTPSAMGSAPDPSNTRPPTTARLIPARPYFDSGVILVGWSLVARSRIHDPSRPAERALGPVRPRIVGTSPRGTQGPRRASQPPFARLRPEFGPEAGRAEANRIIRSERAARR